MTLRLYDGRRGSLLALSAEYSLLEGCIHFGPIHRAVDYMSSLVHFLLSYLLPLPVVTVLLSSFLLFWFHRTRFNSTTPTNIESFKTTVVVPTIEYDLVSTAAQSTEYHHYAAFIIIEGGSSRRQLSIAEWASLLANKNEEVSTTVAKGITSILQVSAFLYLHITGECFSLSCVMFSFAWKNPYRCALPLAGGGRVMNYKNRNSSSHCSFSSFHILLFLISFFFNRTRPLMPFDLRQRVVG